tara:strand:- start:1209 stop:1373 length:165 start_codon:yes stop_codon:yes gene_type:complete
MNNFSGKEEWKFSSIARFIVIMTIGVTTNLPPLFSLENTPYGKGFAEPTGFLLV